MRNKTIVVCAIVIALTPITLATVINLNHAQKVIVGVTPQEVRWFTPPYYKDGRQRAQMLGDSTKDGAWIDRVKIPAGVRALAHTHSQDEIVTVIEGTGIWAKAKNSMRLS